VFVWLLTALFERPYMIEKRMFSLLPQTTEMMTSARFLRRASVVLAAFTLACGDSTGLSDLSEAQVGDMLDAMAAVSYAGNVSVPGAAFSRASLKLAPQTANAVVSVSETVDCPNGGSASYSGSADSDEEAGTLSAQVNQSFNGCAATSSEGRVWTFTGNVASTLDASSNQETGEFSVTATQVGAIQAASNLGSGGCAINMTLTVSGNETAGTLSVSLSGSACGRNIEQSIEVSQ
jgi:hypothetical protein